MRMKCVTPEPIEPPKVVRAEFSLSEARQLQDELHRLDFKGRYMLWRLYVHLKETER